MRCFYVSVFFDKINHFANFAYHPKQLVLTCLRRKRFPFISVFILKPFLHI